jgi:hypothetical protein
LGRAPRAQLDLDQAVRFGNLQHAGQQDQRLPRSTQVRQRYSLRQDHPGDDVDQVQLLGRHRRSLGQFDRDVVRVVQRVQPRQHGEHVDDSRIVIAVADLVERRFQQLDAGIEL